MVELDCTYIRKRSLWLDAKIAARTIGVMFTGKGAG
jgi:lipopolysaccharide/colanic/teichoic acid biosynthesis glycosyltransferase